MSIDGRLTSPLKSLSPSHAQVIGSVEVAWPSSGSLHDLRWDEARWQYMAKRTIDLVGSAVALVLFSPVMVLVAILIRLDSPGPIFFRQERPGLGGRLFRIWKFRTMVVDAEARLAELERKRKSMDQFMFKMEDDPRVTKLGRFLRTSSLDELPQLFNVLLGHMSLVGPRPNPVRDSVRLRELNPNAYDLRLAVMPGLSGLWQVSGRSDLSSEQMLELDHQYITMWSLPMDLKIIVQTIWILIKRQGAY